MQISAFRERSLKFPLWMLTIGMLSIAGLSVIVYGFIRGHENTFNITTGVPWGILICTYLFFVLPASGLCILASLGHAFGVKRFEPLSERAVLLALVMLLSGFLVIASDLERPWLMLLYVFITPNPTSAIWWMGVLYAVYFITLTVEFLFLNRTHAVEKLEKDSESLNIFERIVAVGATKDAETSIQRSRMLSRYLSMVTPFLAVAALSTLGAVFGLTGARALWHGPMLPLYFVLSALIGGGAILTFATVITYQVKGESMPQITQESVLSVGRILLVTLGIFFLFTVWILLTAQYGRNTAEFNSVMILMNGSLAPSFWVFEVFLGIITPIAILLYTRTRRVPAVALASAFVIIGMFAARYDLIIAGQLVPIIGRADLWSYVPSPVEILSVLGAVFLCVFLYSLGDHFLPLGEATGLEEPSREDDRE